MCHGACVEVMGHFVGDGSLLLPYGSQGPSSGCQLGQPETLPADTPPQPTWLGSYINLDWISGVLWCSLGRAWAWCFQGLDILFKNGIKAFTVMK